MISDLQRAAESVRRGRKALLPADAKEISLRLWKHRRRYYKSFAEFIRRIGVSQSTVSGWFGREPHTPDVAQLLVLARKANLSLNWLLLGELPQLLGTPQSGKGTSEHFRQAVIGELVARGVAHRTELEELVLDADQLFETTVDRWNESVSEWLPNYRELVAIRKDTEIISTSFIGRERSLSEALDKWKSQRRTATGKAAKRT